MKRLAAVALLVLALPASAQAGKAQVADGDDPAPECADIAKVAVSAGLRETVFRLTARGPIRSEPCGTGAQIAWGVRMYVRRTSRADCSFQAISPRDYRGALACYGRRVRGMRMSVSGSVMTFRFPTAAIGRGERRLRFEAFVNESLTPGTDTTARRTVTIG